MTPKEKADELFNKFRTEILSFLGDTIKDRNAKRCALIAVDEIIKAREVVPEGLIFDRAYWEEIKQEIESL